MTIKLTAQQLSMRFKDRVLFHIPEIAIGLMMPFTLRATMVWVKPPY